MRILFVCSRNRRRSPTAEAQFASQVGVETLSAGTAVDAETIISAELIEWADLIFAMETVHRRRLEDQFAKLLAQKRVVVLGVADRYRYMDSQLVEILRKKVSPYLPVRDN
jgi:predicted protein tyrosine phosphatase